MAMVYLQLKSLDLPEDIAAKAPEELELLRPRRGI
jgi:hypothetical protein